MAVVQVLGVVLLVLAASMTAASEVVLTRANPGVSLPLWGKPLEPNRPNVIRVLTGLAVGSAFLGSITLDAGDDAHIVWWAGAALVGAAVSFPGIIIRVAVDLFRRLQGRRKPVQRH